MVSVVATTPVKALLIPRAPLLKLVDSIPSLYKDFYALSHINTKIALNLLANLAISPAEARVAARLLMYEPDKAPKRNDICLSHEKLAELVALSAATVQRVLASMQEQRLIEVSYSRIRVLDRGGLLALCGRGRQSNHPHSAVPVGER
jgi:CRP-like cAMP-binding protein